MNYKQFTNKQTVKIDIQIYYIESSQILKCITTYFINMYIHIYSHNSNNNSMNATLMKIYSTPNYYY